MASLLESIKRKSQIVVTQINTLIAAINDKLDMKTGGKVEGDLTVTGDITGTLKGNASTATKLKTARTIGISDGATGTATSFDGSGNITIPVTALDMSKASGTLAVARGGTGLTKSPSMLINLSSTSAANVLAASPCPGVTGVLPVANGGTGSSTKNFVDLSSNQTVAGNKTFSGRIIVSNTTDIAGAKANSGAFIVGSESGTHLGIDSNEIIAKETGTTSGTLNLQTDGGIISCGKNTALTSFTVKSEKSTFSGTLTVPTLTVSGTLTVPTLTVSTTLNIPGGKIWIE